MYSKAAKTTSDSTVPAKIIVLGWYKRRQPSPQAEAVPDKGRHCVQNTDDHGTTGATVLYVEQQSAHVEPNTYSKIMLYIYL